MENVETRSLEVTRSDVVLLSACLYRVDQMMNELAKHLEQGTISDENSMRLVKSIMTGRGGLEARLFQLIQEVDDEEMTRDLIKKVSKTVIEAIQGNKERMTTLNEKLILLRNEFADEKDNNL